MQGVPGISVIIPSYNRLERLKLAVASVLDQTVADWELLIVDDGSNDGTQAWLATVSDPRIRTFSHPDNKGANAARNLGLAAATAPWVAFLDSDDQYLPGHLRTVLGSINNAYGVLIARPRYVSSRATSTRKNVHDVELTSRQFEAALANYRIDPSTSGIVLPRAIADEVGGFDESVGRIQDREFLLRVSQIVGCRQLETVTWEKHKSTDGISRSIEGQIPAFIELVKRFPKYNTEYRTARDYNLARTLIKLARRLRFKAVLSGYLAARRNLESPSDLIELLRAYRRAKDLRKTSLEAGRER